VLLRSLEHSSQGRTSKPGCVAASLHTIVNSEWLWITSNFIGGLSKAVKHGLTRVGAWPSHASACTPTSPAGRLAHPFRGILRDYSKEAAPLVAVFDEWAPRTPNSKAFMTPLVIAG